MTDPATPAPVVAASGTGPDPDDPADTLDARLERHAAARPDAAALVLPRAPWSLLEGGPREGTALARRVGDRAWRTTTFADLARRVDDVAAGLRAAGIGPGTRTALLVPPTAEFFVVAYALMRVRAVPVVVDPGIGLRRVRDCLGEAAPTAFVGVPRAHLARRLWGWCPAATIAVSTGALPLPGTVPLSRIEADGAGRAVPDDPRPDGDPAAILFTSGSTGPPKGVEHRDEGLRAQAALVADLYGLGPGDVSVATFPPFALFGPALGMTTVVPRMDPTRPARVRPGRLVAAVRRHAATVMFGSPAVLDRLGRGARTGTSLPSLRTVVSAGAPVARDVQRRVLDLLAPGAQVHTPYGATEALPVTTIGSDELLALPDDGICVGRPVPGVEVTLASTDGAGADVPRGRVGEVVVSGPVVSRAYAERPEATAAAKVLRDGALAHRMGDLASFDDAGRLWFAGRVSHVVATVDGPLHSVPCEEVLNRDPAVRRCALVAAGEEPAFVVELAPGVRWDGDLRAHLLAVAAADPRTASVRTVLRHRGLPVDPRHNSKIDRAALAEWATKRVSR